MEVRDVRSQLSRRAQVQDRFVAIAAAQVAAAKKAVPATKKVEAPDDMMMSVSTGGAEGILQNVGETIPRNPLTPIELLAHTLLLSNEFVYVN